MMELQAWFTYYHILHGQKYISQCITVYCVYICVYTLYSDCKSAQRLQTTRKLGAYGENGKNNANNNNKKIKQIETDIRFIYRNILCYCLKENAIYYYWIIWCNDHAWLGLASAVANVTDHANAISDLMLSILAPAKDLT